MACNIVLPLSMQQPAATKPQQEQCLCFSFVIGSTDPAPAIGGAFCMSCGHRHKSGPWQPCTVVVDEDLTVLVKASGRTVLPSGIGHSLKQQNVMSSLSLRKDDILELQRKCKPGEYVYPRLVGRHKTAVCSASYQVRVQSQEPPSSNTVHAFMLACSDAYWNRSAQTMDTATGCSNRSSCDCRELAKYMRCALAAGRVARWQIQPVCRKR